MSVSAPTTTVVPFAVRRAFLASRLGLLQWFAILVRARLRSLRAAGRC